MSYINKNIFRSAVLALSAMAGLAFTSQQAHAWDWDDVQEAAYEVQDRTDTTYDLAAAEARNNNPDEEYALELLGQLSVDADKFVDALNQYPWMASSYTDVQYRQLYESYYRADTALNYAHFSYRVDQAFDGVQSAMERLRIEYNFRYVPPTTWVYLTYRDYWYYRLGHRHDRIRWGRYIHDRRSRRPINRDRWRRSHPRPPHLPPRRPVRPPNRPPVHRPPNRPPNRPPVRPNPRPNPRPAPGPVRPPNRDPGHRPAPRPPRRDNPGHVRPSPRPAPTPRPAPRPPRRDNPGHVRPSPRPGNPGRNNPGRPSRPSRPGHGGGRHG